MKKTALFLVKYLVALAMVSWVLHQADLEGIRGVLSHISPFYILLAVGFFNAGQAASSERMRYYYRREGFSLERGFTLRLTYVSMFYNLLVPGGIGGDAYRVVLLDKLHGVPLRTGVRLQLSNRLNGLLAISLLILALLVFSSLHFPALLLATGIPLCLLMLAGVYHYLFLPLLKESYATAGGALLWSLAAQLLALAGVAALCTGLGSEPGQIVDYLLLYLIAALAGMLPITIGGLGIREFTFFYGAHWLQKLGGASLHPELGVTLALACFGITLASSMLGVVWMPGMKKRRSEVEASAAA